MKLLYIASGHPLQEADDCLMWEKLGIEWVSTGYYSNSDKPGDLPEIKKTNIGAYRMLSTQKRWTHSTDEQNTACGKKNFQWTNQVARNRIRLDRKFIQYFDAVLFNFFIKNVADSWSAMKDKKIFLKTYSMHEHSDEDMMEKYRNNGLKIIRNSPKEHMRGNPFAGADAIIRGSVVKDENEISGWTGHNKRVCTFTSYMEHEKRRLGYFNQICQNCAYTVDLFGIGNNFITHEQKLDVLRGHRVNLVTGTPNANNTYSMVEAWIMGQPIVVFGQNMWNSMTYECHELVEHGVTGFIGNTPEECVKYINILMEDEDLARRIGAAGREAAIKIYGRETLALQWKQLFKDNDLL